MKRFVIILVVLLVVAGGGAAGLVMLGIVRNPFLKPGADAVATAAAEADKANAFKGPTEALTLVKMSDLIVPVIVNGQVSRRIFINLRIQSRPADKARVQNELPRFQNEVIKDLVPYFQTYFERHDMIDVEAVRKRLRSHAEQVYGEAVIDVLLVNIFESGSASAAKGTFSESSD